MLRVLIAEDDLIIADLAEEILVARGYAVCGIARTVDEAVALGQRAKPDIAIIDQRLADGGLGTEIAARLCPIRTLGVLYITATVSQVLRVATEGDACLAKPYRPSDLIRALEVVACIVATGMALPPFPRGFRVLPAIVARQEARYG